MVVQKWLSSSVLVLLAASSNVQGFTTPSTNHAFIIQSSTNNNVINYIHSFPALNKPARTSSSTTELNMWGGDEEMSGSDRIKSCIPYMLPILDGDHWGRFIYQRIPPLNIADQILIQPLLNFYDSIPFLGLGIFLLLSFGSRNPALPRSVRFNAQQAVLIDIALIFPEIIEAVSPGNMPRFIVEPASNFVYYAYVSAVLYSIGSNLSGKKPNQIPWISEAAEMAVGPF